MVNDDLSSVSQVCWGAVAQGFKEVKQKTKPPLSIPCCEETNETLSKKHSASEDSPAHLLQT